MMYIYSLFVFFTRKKSKLDKDYQNYPISIIVPAYNEEISIVTCIETLSGLDYPDYELVVVNDGSKDKTMEVLLNNFKFEKITDKNLKTGNLGCANINDIYVLKGRNIFLIDKENGGKADAINAGINYAKGDYICTIDADSILDPDALKYVVNPFINKPETIVSGGQLAASNDVEIRKNKVISSKMPKNIWVQWQIIEYIKSFLISRLALSKINALLIMSGAFSLFKKSDLLKVGGFLSKNNNHPYIEKNIGKGVQTVCEDMEIVVRLWKYKYDKKQKANAEFVPDAICWTEVPEKPSSLFKQRSRWHQGLGETLKYHQDMIFEPKYKITGLLGMPYYAVFEFFSPFMKVFSLIFVLIAAQFGILNIKWILLLLLSILLATAVIMSSITTVVEYWGNKHTSTGRHALRYKSFWDWFWLMISGILAEFSYSFFKIIAQLDGIINFAKKKHDWKKFERKGVKVERK